MIINPKCGDKVISSNTDAKIAEYCVLFEQSDQSKSVNEHESDDENSDKKKTDNKKPPSTWKFFHDKKNDPNYKQGFRIQVIHQKVSLNFTTLS